MLTLIVEVFLNSNNHRMKLLLMEFLFIRAKVDFNDPPKKLREPKITSETTMTGSNSL